MDKEESNRKLVDNKIKVLWFVTPTNNNCIMGGTLGRIVKWYRAIDKNRYEVHILISGRSESSLQKLQAEFYKVGIRVDVISGLCLPKVLLPRFSRCLTDYVDEISPDIIHTLFIHSDLIGAFFKRRMGVRSLFSSLEGALYPRKGVKAVLFRGLYFILRKNIDQVIALCLFTKDQAVNEYDVMADRCQVIYSALDCSLFSFPKKIRSPDELIKVGFLGYIGPGKCIDLFVDMIPPMLKFNENLRFVIGGIGKDLERIIAKVELLGITQAVEFRGFVSDSSSFFGEIDIYVFLSQREGLPWVILESQAAGVPTIASCVGGVPEVISEGYNGMLLEVHSVDELCQKLKTLIDDVNLRELFSKNSRHNIEERFNGRMEMQQIEALYSNCSGIRKPRQN